MSEQNPHKGPDGKTALYTRQKARTRRDLSLRGLEAVHKKPIQDEKSSAPSPPRLESSPAHARLRDVDRSATGR